MSEVKCVLCAESCPSSEWKEHILASLSCPKCGERCTISFIAKNFGKEFIETEFKDRRITLLLEEAKIKSLPLVKKVAITLNNQKMLEAISLKADKRLRNFRVLKSVSRKLEGKLVLVERCGSSDCLGWTDGEVCILCGGEGDGASCQEDAVECEVMTITKETTAVDPRIPKSLKKIESRRTKAPHVVRENNSHISKFMLGKITKKDFISALVKKDKLNLINDEFTQVRDRFVKANDILIERVKKGEINPEQANMQSNYCVRYFNEKLDELSIMYHMSPPFVRFF